MSDVRLHLISLAAVFLALAVGIVLGSGPMRTALVGELTDDVAHLEAQLLDAQQQVELERDTAATGEQFLDHVAPAVIGGTLEGTGVALVAVAGADPDDVEAQRQRIVDAGGSVTAVVTVDEAWTDNGQSAFRSALAVHMADNVDSAAGLPPDRVLAHALAQTLLPSTGSVQIDELMDDDDPAVNIGGPESDPSGLLLELLREAELVTGTVSDSAQAVVIVAGQGQDDPDERTLESSLLAQLAGTFAEYDVAVVVATGVDDDADVARAVRDSAALAAQVSTVSSATTQYGRVSVVLALAEQLRGDQGHYGPGDDRSLAPAPAVMSP